MTGPQPRQQPNPLATTLVELRQRMERFVAEQIAAFITRVMPDGRMPAYLAGYAVSPNDAMALAKNLAWLEARGATSVAGHAPRELIRNLLRVIDGASMEVFNSFQLSELLLRYGAFADNPLLAGFSDTERANLADGCDSSHIRMQHGKTLGGRPNNYWAVLARCEWGRLRLGLISDRTLFSECLDNTLALLAANPEGWFDDHREQGGRYDIYSLDTLFFLEPLWDSIAREPTAAANLARMQRQAVGLVEDIALDKASIAWGRTINGHSQAMLMESLAVGLEHGWTRDAALALRRIDAGFTALAGLFHDGLVDIHRQRAIERYRATWRLFESTVDLIGKVAYAADALAAVDPGALAGVAADTPAVLPDADLWIPFDRQNAGVWFHRAEGTAFQFPVVAINDPSSYLPFPHAPGLFENPCDNFHVTGAPRVLLAGRQYTTGGRPTALRKLPHGLELTWDGFTACDEVPYNGPMIPWTPPRHSDLARLPGRRTASFTVSGRSLRVEEEWSFPTLPAAIQLDVAEAGTPLRVSVECPTPHLATIIPVLGFPDWHSVWGPLRRLHQLAVTPASELRLAWTVSW